MLELLLDEWRRMLADEGVPFVQIDARVMGLPSFFLPGKPNHWLQVVDQVRPGTIDRLEAICKATCTDGYLAVGYPGTYDVMLMISETRPVADRRRYAQILLNRDTAK